MQHKILFADQLRALAIFFVLLAHYFGVFWYDPSILHYTNISPYLVDRTVPAYVPFVNPTFIPYLNWGPLGVDIFFLISGFVIPISLERYTWKQFAIQRILRLYPTYFVGFLFLVSMILLSAYYFHNPFMYHWSTIVKHAIIGGRELASLPSIDTVVWTLEVELKFYILSAIFIVWFKKKSLYIFFIPAMLALLLYYMLPTFFTTIHVIYMYIGTVFYYHFRSQVQTRYAVVIAVCIFLLFSIVYFLLGKGYFPEAYLYQMVANGIYALAIFTLAYYLRRKFTYNRYIGFVSGISYPFYVIHSVSGYVLMFIGIDLGLSPALSMMIALCIIVSVAYLLHRYIEIPSQRLGKKLTKTIK